MNVPSGSVAIVALIAAVLPAAAADLVAITDRGEFLQFSSDNPRETIRRDLQGAGVPMVGIDVRPADGRLYGLDREGGIHHIDVASGVATLRARLSLPLGPAAAWVVDFDPADGRLVVVGSDGRALRADPDTGAAVAIGALRTADGGVPRITAGAHAGPGAFFVFDGAGESYGRVDGALLRPVVHAPGIAPEAADIGREGGRPVGYSALRNILHAFDPATGAAFAVQAIGTGATGRAGRIIDLAILP
jgi:hypothetical protein